MNELAIRNTEIIHSVDELLKLGATLVKSGLLPYTIKTPESAAAIVLMGRELNIGAMTALTMIQPIQGKPTVPPQLMLALARRTKEFEDLKITDDGQTCFVTVTRKGQSPLTTSFSMENAKAMKLDGKDNWLKQPETMRKWRAVAANLRLTFTDAVAGLYIPEEMGVEVDNDGVAVKDVIQGEIISGETQSKDAVQENELEQTTETKNLIPKEKVKLLHDKAAHRGYATAKVSLVEKGLVGVVNKGKSKFEELTMAEGRLLAGYLDAQKDVPEEQLKDVKLAAKACVVKCLAEGKEWGDVWEQLKPQEKQSAAETPENPNSQSAVNLV